MQIQSNLREKIKVTQNKRNGRAGKRLLLFLGEGASRPFLCSRQHMAMESAASPGEVGPGSSPTSGTC